MSSFLHRGKRQQKVKQIKEVKERTKDFYKILADLDEVADKLKEDDTVTNDNLQEKAEALTDRKIENLELFILKGKLGLYETMQDNIPRHIAGVDPYENHPKEIARREEDELSKES